MELLRPERSPLRHARCGRGRGCWSDDVVHVLARTATAFRGDAWERRIIGVRFCGAASVRDFPLVGVTRDAVVGTGRAAWSVRSGGEGGRWWSPVEREVKVSLTAWGWLGGRRWPGSWPGQAGLGLRRGRGRYSGWWRL
jgi:hypothetical protein